MKRRLMTPGPTHVPEAALLTLAKQVYHHRTPEFLKTFAEVLAGLKEVFQTQGDVVVLTSSGTGAMEAAVVNAVPRGGKAIVLESGKFSERWRNICEAFGVTVVKYEVPWGEAFQPAEVAKLLKAHPDAVAVFSTLMESSTGVGHDIRGIGEVVSATGTLFVVDGISGAGVMECRTDDWGVDMLIAGSQKALMLPPGLAFITVNAKAWKQIEKVTPQAFYFDLKQYRKALGAGPDTPWTSAHTLIQALGENLKELLAEGIENVWQRGKTLSQACRAGCEVIGLEMYAQRPAEGLTAVRMPAGIDGSKVIKKLETDWGIKVAEGQGPAKGKIIRIAHMGIVDALDIIGTLTALEIVLDELGHTLEIGAATTAASRVLAEARTAKV